MFVIKIGKFNFVYLKKVNFKLVCDNIFCIIKLLGELISERLFFSVDVNVIGISKCECVKFDLEEILRIIGMRMVVVFVLDNILDIKLVMIISIIINWCLFLVKWLIMLLILFVIFVLNKVLLIINIVMNKIMLVLIKFKNVFFVGNMFVMVKLMVIIIVVIVSGSFLSVNIKMVKLRK